MFKFLKNIMNNEESILTNEINSVHRILKTDIKKIPIFKKVKYYLGVVVSGARKMFLELQELLQLL